MPQRPPEVGDGFGPEPFLQIAEQAGRPPLRRRRIRQARGAHGGGRPFRKRPKVLLKAGLHAPDLQAVETALEGGSQHELLRKDVIVRFDDARNLGNLLLVIAEVLQLLFVIRHVGGKRGTRPHAEAVGAALKIGDAGVRPKGGPGGFEIGLMNRQCPKQEAHLGGAQGRPDVFIYFRGPAGGGRLGNFFQSRMVHC